MATWSPRPRAWRATGGDAQDAGAAGDGGTAHANASGASLGNATVDVHARAWGGRGGEASGAGSSGDGGEAHATAIGSNAGSATVTVTSEAFAGDFFATPGTGNAGGASSSATAHGSSTGGGDVVVTARLLPGGQRDGIAVASGDAIDVSMTDAVGGSTGGHLRLVQELAGAEAASAVAAAGDGGDAIASLAAENPGGGSLESDVSVVGGAGGLALEGGVGGDGGRADLGRVSGISIAGADVVVRGTATGGRGGSFRNAGTAGQGAGTMLLDAVDGSTSGALTLEQGAVGGRTQEVGLTTIGGSASSGLTRTSGAASFHMTADALGGWGDAGGDALASAFGTGLATTAQLDVVARAEVGREEYLDELPAPIADSRLRVADARARAEGVGVVNATATSTAGSQRFSPLNWDTLASARATATGTSGSATAVADRGMGSVGSSTLSKVAIASQAVGIGHIAEAAAFASDADRFVSFSSHSEAGAFASISSVGDLATALEVFAAQPIVAAAYGAQADGTLALVGSLGARCEDLCPGAAGVYDARLQFAVGSHDTELTSFSLGLFDPDSEGAGFQELALEVVFDGVSVLEVQFDDRQLAFDYFDDQVLDLTALLPGVSGVVDAEILMTLVSDIQDSAFGFDVTAFYTSEQIPEPSVPLLVGFGLALLRFAGSARCHRPPTRGAR